MKPKTGDKPTIATVDRKSAFPTGASTITQGMDLRDWFAGQIVAQMAGKGTGVFGSVVGNMAHQAYILADAMMLERRR